MQAAELAIAREHGPFDLAFLPVNGTIATFEGYEADVPSP